MLSSIVETEDIKSAKVMMSRLQITQSMLHYLASFSVEWLIIH